MAHLIVGVWLPEVCSARYSDKEGVPAEGQCEIGSADEGIGRGGLQMRRASFMDSILMRLRLSCRSFHLTASPVEAAAPGQEAHALCQPGQITFRFPGSE